MICYRLIKIIPLCLLVMHPVQAYAAQNNETARLYAETCSVCHGENGDGRSHASAGLKPPPKDFTTPSAKQQLTREYMIEVIRHGKPGTAMAGFASQLSDAQIGALADYISSRFMTAAAGTGAWGGPAGRR